MTERSTFDAFEQRLAAEFERYVAAATDPRPTTEIAEMAMQPRGLAVRARNASGRRRVLLLGVAAAFLVPAAYIGAGGIRQAAPDRAARIQPSSPTDVRATALPSIATASVFVAPSSVIAIPDGAMAVSLLTNRMLPSPGREGADAVDIFIDRFRPGEIVDLAARGAESPQK